MNAKDCSRWVNTLRITVHVRASAKRHQHKLCPCARSFSLRCPSIYRYLKAKDALVPSLSASDALMPSPEQVPAAPPLRTQVLAPSAAVSAQNALLPGPF
eukprot:384996-Pelagomonas_calceolata.AAC.2